MSSSSDACHADDAPDDTSLKPRPSETTRVTRSVGSWDDDEPIPRSEPMRAIYDEAYRTVPNWDVGHPQAPFRWLTERGLVRSPVLDLGCGTGELSIYLAELGFEVLGVDISGRAVAEARRRATGRGVDVLFLRLDALALGRLVESGFQFRTVLDSATFHVFDAWERDRLAQILTDLVPPGGLFCVLGDRRSAPRPTYGITPEEVTRRFQRAGAWERLFAYETGFQRRWGSSPAYFVGLRRV